MGKNKYLLTTALLGLTMVLPLLLYATPILATVLHVIDGDDLYIKIQGRMENIRLIGIDAPEKSANEKALRQTKGNPDKLKTMIRHGKAAMAHLQTLVHRGEAIKVVEGSQNRDEYGRLLGYVFLPDGTFLNEKMMKDGYAVPLAIAPNTRYQDLFKREYEQAKNNQVGLWSQEGLSKLDEEHNIGLRRQKARSA